MSEMTPEKLRKWASLVRKHADECPAWVLDLAAESLEKQQTHIEELGERRWWARMSRGDIAAELSGTFDLGLGLTLKISDWILADGALAAEEDSCPPLSSDV